MGKVSQEVERRGEEAAVRVSPQQAIKQSLDRYRPVFSKLLAGTGVSEDNFAAQIANACRATPALFRCAPETVLGAALRCAQLGLAPNDVRNLAWIIPYGNQAQFQIGYGGIMELARRAVPGLRFDGRPVYPNDEFDVDYGKADPLTHRPAVARGMGRGGDAYAWYVRAVFPDGSVQIHLLDKEGVEYHRSFSKVRDRGMWADNYDAAALKSVVLDMKRWLPSSTQLVAALASDEQTLEVTDVDEIDTIEVTHTPTPEPENDPGPAPADGTLLAT